MSWQPEVDEMLHRRQLALKMGGTERVDRQHAQGKLTIRERIEGVLDPGSFREVGGLAGGGVYKDGKLVDFTPSAWVGGLGQIDGRWVVVGGEDFTISGGSPLTRQARSKAGFFETMAREYQVPLILFLDGAGANVGSTSHEGHSHMPSSFDVFGPLIHTGKDVPVAGAIVGSIAGAVAARAMLCHFTVMSEPGGALFAAGPPVVRRALGSDVTKAQLGGAEVHVAESGAVENRAPDERDAFQQIRKWLSYLPANVNELPPVRPSADPPDREEEELLHLVPRNRARAYNMRRLLELIVDDGDFFEVQPEFGTSVITVLTRVAGYPVGIVANNPRMMGGAMSAASADKQCHFLEFCDHFHLPVVYLADVPGFMIGPQAEARGTLRHGMRAYWVGYGMTVPLFTVVIRKCYGMGGQAMGHAGRLNYRVGWPSGEWGSIPIEGGVDAAFRREIEAAPDPAKRRQEIEAELGQYRNPFRTAEAFGIEDLIDPRQTRAHIARFLEIGYHALKSDVGLKTKAGVRP